MINIWEEMKKTSLSKVETRELAKVWNKRRRNGSIEQTKKEGEIHPALPAQWPNSCTSDLDYWHFLLLSKSAPSCPCAPSLAGAGTAHQITDSLLAGCDGHLSSIHLPVAPDREKYRPDGDNS